MRIALALVGLIVSITANADIKNYEAEGNLESSRPVNCISTKELTTKNSPADIYIGVNKCVNEDDFDKAVQLYFISLAYGKYDTLRVSDRSAHQAVTVLRMNHLGALSEEQTANFQAAFKKAAENMNAVCNSIKTLGKPTYYPKYMIQHGMGAFTGQKTKDGLVVGFDPDQAWSDVLEGYVKCSK
ncbi:hypothetical protein [Microbulbifer sp. SSSA005]|uniref:hypothetical protein n=1 Tax=unclassified Microbulbifer TaxID=2619833 RepID=UPI004039E018